MHFFKVIKSKKRAIKLTKDLYFQFEKYYFLKLNNYIKCNYNLKY